MLDTGWAVIWTNGDLLSTRPSWPLGDNLQWISDKILYNNFAMEQKCIFCNATKCIGDVAYKMLAILFRSLSMCWYMLVEKNVHFQCLPSLEQGQKSARLALVGPKPWGPSMGSLFSTSRPRQNGQHFPDDIPNFLNKNVWISVKISQKFVPEGPINNIPALAQIMAWHRPGDKPLSELMMVKLPTHMRHSVSMS